MKHPFRLLSFLGLVLIAFPILAACANPNTTLRYTFTPGESHSYLLHRHVEGDAKNHTKTQHFVLDTTSFITLYVNSVDDNGIAEISLTGTVRSASVNNQPLPSASSENYSLTVSPEGQILSSSGGASFLQELPIALPLSSQLLFPILPNNSEKTKSWSSQFATKDSSGSVTQVGRGELRDTHEGSPRMADISGTLVSHIAMSDSSNTCSNSYRCMAPMTTCDTCGYSSGAGSSSGGIGASIKPYIAQPNVALPPPSTFCGPASDCANPISPPAKTSIACPVPAPLPYGGTPPTRKIPSIKSTPGSSAGVSPIKPYYPCYQPYCPAMGAPTNSSMVPYPYCPPPCYFSNDISGGRYPSCHPVQPSYRYSGVYESSFSASLAEKSGVPSQLNVRTHFSLVRALASTNSGITADIEITGTQTLSLTTPAPEPSIEPLPFPAPGVVEPDNSDSSSTSPPSGAAIIEPAIMPSATPLT